MVSEKLTSWLPVVLWCCVIFFLSSLPTVETTKIYWWDFIIKKSAHIIEYGILYFLSFEAVNQLGFRVEKNKIRVLKNPINLKNLNFKVPLIFGFLYSLTDEFHQRFVPGRHAKIMDVGFDLLGMLLMLLLIRTFLIKYAKAKTAK